MAQDSFELRSVLWTALSQGLLNDVYSHVPQGAEYPYVAIGEIMALNADTKTEDILEYDVALHIYDKDTESTAITEILFAEIQDILNDRESTLLPTGYKVVICRLTSQRIVPYAYESGAPGADKVIHGLQRYTLLVQNV